MASILHRNFRKSRPANSRGALYDVDKRWRLLAISSSMDEAWQVIHHVRNAENPLSVSKSVFGYIIGEMSDYRRVRFEKSRIHGAWGYADLNKSEKIFLFVLHLFTTVAIIFTAYTLYQGMMIDWDAQGTISEGPFIGMDSGGLASVSLFILWLTFVFPLFLSLFLATIYANNSGRNFLSAYWSPFRWCALWVGSLKSSLGAAVTYRVRAKAWPLIQSLALGLEGYPYRLPQVERKPTHFGAGEITYEDLPTDVEARALSSRSDWVARHLGSFSKTFSTISVTSADINTLLRRISLDQSLVHSSYYTDDACIERIADWIADDR